MSDILFRLCIQKIPLTEHIMLLRTHGVSSIYQSENEICDE